MMKARPSAGLDYNVEMQWSRLLQRRSKYSQLLPCEQPRYNRHPDKRDSSLIPGKNKLQTFD